jgi:hypothetical protein
MKLSSRDTRQQGALAALLSSTLFKDGLRTRLRSADPANGARSVNVMLGKDPEVALAILSSIPAAVNTIVSALTELGLRLGNYPPPLIGSMAKAVAEDIDRDAIRTCAGTWKALAEGVFASPGLAAGIALTIGARVKAGAINALAKFINDVSARDPHAWSVFLAEVLRRVDHEQARRASLAVANAFLDQRWGIPSFVAELFFSRIRSSIGRFLGRVCGNVCQREG